jgi:hypothetical protein
VQEQLIKEKHCLAVLRLYLEFRDFILAQSGKDANDVCELIVSTKGVAARPGKVFTAATKKLLGKSIPQGVFRKIFETGVHEAGLSEEDRKLYSEHALHSLQVANDYYVSKDINRAVC